MLMKKNIAAACMACALMFAGCTSTFEDNPLPIGATLTNDQWKAQRAELLELENFTVKGKVELNLVQRSRYVNDGGTKGSARYSYSQFGVEKFSFTVTHPMAGQLLAVKKKAGGMEMTDSDGDVYKFESEREFVDAVKLPVSRLPWWMMGVTLGDEKNIIREQDGRLVSFSNSDWTIHYHEYEQLADGKVLPKRLTASSNNFGTIRITVGEWNLKQ